MLSQAELILQWLTRVVDKKQKILNEPLSTVKFLVRIKDGIISEPEISVDLSRELPKDKN